MLRIGLGLKMAHRLVPHPSLPTPAGAFVSLIGCCTRVSALLRPTAAAAPATAVLSILRHREQSTSTATVAKPSPRPHATRADSSTAATAIPPPYPVVAPATNQKGRGLLDFFDSEAGWSWKSEEPKHGRAWTAEELRTKSFDDLHKLWWICIKEKNKLLSQQDEAVRFAVIFFHKPRMRQVKRTMRNIKLVLWERRIAYMQAQAIVERETTRMALLRQYQEEEDGKENAQDEPAADPAALERRAEAELRRRFPVPVHEIGRQAAAKRRVQEARRKAKRPRHKGTRWFVV